MQPSKPLSSYFTSLGALTGSGGAAGSDRRCISVSFCGLRSYDIVYSNFKGFDRNNKYLIDI